MDDKKEKDTHDKRSKTELRGLEVLRKNLDEHVEDLNRWMKYLDYDTQTELDFADVRSQVYKEIQKDEFDDQLEKMSKKLGKENEEILAFLKQKEIELKAKKANEKKKKERQKKSDE